MLLMLIGNKKEDLKKIQIAQMAQYLFKVRIEIFAATINM